MGKNKAVALLAGVLIVLGAVVGYLWLQVKNVREQAPLLVFSNKYSIVAGGLIGD